MRQPVTPIQCKSQVHGLYVYSILNRVTGKTSKTEPSKTSVVRYIMMGGSVRDWRGRLAENNKNPSRDRYYYYYFKRIYGDVPRKELGILYYIVFTHI